MSMLPTPPTPNMIPLSDTQNELAWLSLKLYLQTLPEVRPVRRGEVYWCQFGHNIKCELRDRHPCVILQSNLSNATAWNVVVAPITHATNRKNIMLIPIQPQTNAVGQIVLEGFVDLTNIRTVSKARITVLKDAKTLLPKEMKAIDEALARNLDLMRYYADSTRKLETSKEYARKLERKTIALRDALGKILLAVQNDDKDQALDDILNYSCEAFRL